MSKVKPTKDFIIIDDILKLLRDRLSLRLTKAAVYGYIARKDFPRNIGLGTPRLWRRAEVLEWISRYEK